MESQAVLSHRPFPLVAGWIHPPEVEENFTLPVYDVGRKCLGALFIKVSVNLWATEQEVKISEIIIQGFTQHL